MSKQKSKKVTIGDVARVAGVSVSTVSRVLNKEPHVKEVKRVAVEEAVAKLQYSPSMYARSLAAGRSKQIALMFYDPRGDYIASLLQGALKQCEKEGLHLLVEQIQDSDTVGRLEEFLKKMKVDGMILAPPICDDEPVLALLAKNNIPTVLMAPSKDYDGTIGVGIDEYGAAFEMTEHLISQGHTRIGYVRGHQNHLSTHERYRGFCDALARNGLQLDADLVTQGDYHYESGLECGEILLNREDRPTAIFASNDDMAAGVMAVARKLGIQLPAELAIAGFDDVPIARMLWPPLTTVRQPVTEMATAAINRIVDISTSKSDADNQMLHENILLDYEFVVRSSTAPKAG